MRTDNQKNDGKNKPQQQTGEEFGSIKGRQRGEDDFKGKSDTPRGSEPDVRGSSGPRRSKARSSSARRCWLTSACRWAR